MPIRAGRPNRPPRTDRIDRRERAAEIATTPHRLIAMAAAPAGLTASPRTTRPKTAVCTGSVLEKAVPTAKLRNENRCTSKAVAAICARPPTAAQTAKTRFGAGIGRSNPACRTHTYRAAKGRAQTKREKVDPEVPRLSFRCFCSADRRFWKNAAPTEIATQSSMRPARRNVGNGLPPAPPGLVSRRDWPCRGRRLPPVRRSRRSRTGR